MTEIHLQLVDTMLAHAVQLSYVWLTAYGFKLVAQHLNHRLTVLGPDGEVFPRRPLAYQDDPDPAHDDDPAPQPHRAGRPLGLAGLTADVIGFPQRKSA